LGRGAAPVSHLPPPSTQSLPASTSPVSTAWYHGASGPYALPEREETKGIKNGWLTKIEEHEAEFKSGDWPKPPTDKEMEERRREAGTGLIDVGRGTNPSRLEETHSPVPTVRAGRQSERQREENARRYYSKRTVWTACSTSTLTVDLTGLGV
jgi:hypothetical protein